MSSHHFDPHVMPFLDSIRGARSRAVVLTKNQHGPSCQRKATWSGLHILRPKLPWAYFGYINSGSERRLDCSSVNWNLF